jgi:hypothetical protein
VGIRVTTSYGQQLHIFWRWNLSLITIPALGSIGLIRDQQPHETALSAITDSLNVRFRDTSAERFGGEAAVFSSPSVTPYWLGLYSANTSRFVVHAGVASVFVDDGSTRTDITGTAPTGAAGNRWSGGVLNGVLVMNNGVDQPMYWGGNTALNLATLTGWNATWKANSIRPFKNYLFALNFTKGATNYPHMVKWSAAADPGAVPSSWDEANPAIDAGELDLAETSDVLVDALPMGDTMVIYKQNSMYACTYIGGQYIWQFRRLPGEAGMLARGCACTTPQGHVVLTAGDLIVHNGQGPQSIINGKMRRWLFSAMDSTYYDRAFVVSHPAFSEVWVCFPETGNQVCTKALVWNWTDNTFSVRELANVTYGCSGMFNASSSESWSIDSNAWSSDATTWSESALPLSQARLLLCNTSPKIVVTETGAAFDGSAFTARIERTGLSFDAPGVVKMVKALYPRIEGTAGQAVYVQVGAAMDVEGPYTWQIPINYTVGSSYKADAFSTGRFLAYRIYTTASTPWRVKSLDVEVIKRGIY